MRFHCCPPEKKGGALATPKKGGTVGRSSGAGKGLRGSKGKAKSKNPMADVAADKLTWPALVGLQESLATAGRLAAEASAGAALVGDRVASWRGLPRARLDVAVQVLQDVADYAVQRRS